MLRRVDLVRTTRRNIPEDGILHSYRCENLKFYIVISETTIVICDVPKFEI
jgi:hypothetical protein